MDQIEEQREAATDRRREAARLLAMAMERDVREQGTLIAARERGQTEDCCWGQAPEAEAELEGRALQP